MTSDNIDDFLRLPAGNVLSGAGAGLIRATNPHVRWAELDGHGFGVLEVTPRQCRMDWYHLADRVRADSGARWVAAWSVAAGSARLRSHPAPTA